MATPPVFTAGTVLQAASMNKIGLWLVKEHTIGTAVGNFTVTDAFSSDYDNYLITIQGGAASTTSINLLMTLGSTATGYYYGAAGLSYGGVVTNGGGNNTTSIPAGRANTDGLAGWMYIMSPNLADQTVFHGQYADVWANSSGVALNIGGVLANTTSYTAFTITTSTGNVTGGSVRVYGMRD